MIRRTDNINVSELHPIISPEGLKTVFPLVERQAETVARCRDEVKAVLNGRDKRLMAVIGPCSIHDPAAAVEYAKRLAGLQEKVKETLLLVMRVYFEKPRTTVGWKGLINDPDLDGSHRISKGLGVARKLMLDVTDLGLPTSTETLDPITPQYLAELLSWGAIGARTTESQIHREMASGLSFPVGIKNGTDGNIQIALDAIRAASKPHSFLGINGKGRASVVATLGNPDLHIVLRGGSKGPNYDPESVDATEAAMKEFELNPAIMIDCSHANSYKNHKRQREPLESAVDQVVKGNTSICGVMIESNINEGNQPFPQPLDQLRYGVSITDKCVGWDQTVEMVEGANQRLAAAGGRQLAV